MSRPEFESRLRRSLAARASTATTPPDAWAAIERRKRRQRRGGLLLALAALAALAVAVVVAVPLIMVLGGGEDRMPPAPATRAPATTTPPATTPAPGAGGATATSRPSSTTVAVRPSSVADPGAAVRAIGQQVAGDPVGAVQFTDANGTNLVVLSQNYEERESKLGGPAAWVHVYADQFVTSGGTTRSLRKVQDGVDECPTDDQVALKSDKAEVSDLDGDGVGEVLFGYTVGCVGDISPVDLKILVLEGGDKYILRGETYTNPGQGKEALGRLPVGKPDPAWASWPKGTQALAERYWGRWAIRE